MKPSKTALLKEILDFRYENILQEVRSTITRDIALPPKNIPKKYNQPIKLGIQGYFLDQGAQGIVYALDEKKVLKVIPFKSEKSYQNEITTITNAVRLGISPKLYKHEYLKNFNTAVLESERLIVDLEDYLSDSILSFFEELKKGNFTVFKEFLSDCSYIIPRFYYIDSLSEKLDFGDTNVLKNFMFGRNGVLYYIDYSLPFISEEPIEVDIKEVILSRIEQYLEESGEISAKDSERILTTLMSQS